MQTLVIDKLKGKSLLSLKSDLANAIDGKMSVEINVNSKEPEEILKGTYIAIILSDRGYICDAKLQNDEMNWDCKPLNSDITRLV